MSDLRELYLEVILDHNRQPHNFHEMADADTHAYGKNPLCGDQLTVFVKLEGDRVADVSFIGSGCAISKASASMMTDSVKGKTLAEAEETFRAFHEMVTGAPDTFPDTELLGKLAVFQGVREFPARVKCASLAWHTLQAALHHASEPVTTE
jgi:nitrogen fixation NifU-like protein